MTLTDSLQEKHSKLLQEKYDALLKEHIELQEKHYARQGELLELYTKHNKLQRGMIEMMHEEKNRRKTKMKVQPIKVELVGAVVGAKTMIRISYIVERNPDVTEENACMWVPTKFAKSIAMQMGAIECVALSDDEIKDD